MKGFRFVVRQWTQDCDKGGDEESGEEQRRRKNDPQKREKNFMKIFRMYSCVWYHLFKYFGVS